MTQKEIMDDLKQVLYWQQASKNDMTYILGARCKDGVVLVGDTKVTIGGGTNFEFSKKITTTPLSNIAMGSAGIGGLYKDFQNKIVAEVMRIQEEVNRTKIPSPYLTTDQGFSALVTNVIRKMHQEYDKDRYLITNQLMILCASKIGTLNAKLNLFTGIGFPEPVNEKRAIGHGEPYGALFLNKLWNPDKTMEQIAKLGLFIIQFIQETKLDTSVGYDENYLPQVIYIPDNNPIMELSNDNIKRFMEDIKEKVDIVNTWFKQDKFKL